MWIGIFFDGTLVETVDNPSPDNIGNPIEVSVNRVKQWLHKGIEVRVITHRVLLRGGLQEIRDATRSRENIREWLIKQFGRPLTITAEIDGNMSVLYGFQCVETFKDIGKPRHDND